MTLLRPAPPEAVAAALADLADLGPFFTLAVGEADGVWRPVADAYAEGFAHLVADRVARYGTSEHRIAASVVQLGHAARLWSIVLGCVVAHGVVPDLGDLQQQVDGPALRLPEARGWYVPKDEDVSQVIHRLVMDGHLAALGAGLRVKVAPGLLRGNAGSALAEAARTLLRARPGLRESLTSLADRLLDTGGLRGTGEFTGPDLTFRRRSCCLYYRVPGGGKCGDCSLERSRR
ncbi:(2Fe-2S)-binding protein [Streptosporangium sp. 'caverna']|uniref:(2Fe-2S)-binding protein n=1 Tax=Streptosporangium sp. 'caverna' TaxID=2202249 RepID=UPI000D7E64AC|nr:(2Fe-2S)-binding protein [Streptosporangium sp. 'caverna']AWS43859.1 iron reductase [Streptosporangium sp. 'caverna']